MYWKEAADDRFYISSCARKKLPTESCVDKKKQKFCKKIKKLKNSVDRYGIHMV